MSMGKPMFFSPDAACDVVESLITSDEVERALLLLDNFPSWYRSYPTERMREIRESLQRQFFSSFDYSKADKESVGLIYPDEYIPARASLLFEKIRDLNKDRLTPHIMEIGPGAYQIPLTAEKLELAFTYESQTLGDKLFKDMLPINHGPVIFCAFEVIEHLKDEWELYRAYLKFNKKAQYIFISTPLHTCAAVSPNWRNNFLGHWRCYSPQEIFEKARSMFTGYEWRAHLSDTITLVGQRV